VNKEEGKMSKKLLAIFLLLGVLTYAEDNDTTVVYRIQRVVI